MRTQLVVSTIEWGMLYAAGVQIERLTKGWNSYYSLYHCIWSFLLIIVLPTAGVWWLERLLRAQYADLLAARSATRKPGFMSAMLDSGKLAPSLSNAGSGRGGPRSGLKIIASAATDFASGASSSKGIITHSSIASSSSASPVGPSPAPAASQCQEQLNAPHLLPEGAMAISTPQWLPEAPHRPSTNMDTTATVATVAAAAAVASVPAQLSLAQVAPALTSLLRAEEAAEVFTAAAADSAVMGGSQSMYHYTSMAQCVPASIKVRLAWCLCNLCDLQW